MKLRCFSFKELLKIVAIYLAWTLWFHGLLIYCLKNIFEGSGLESFRLGNVPVYKFYNASYIEVAIFCGALVVAVGVGIYIRYIKYGEELHFRKKYNIKDDRNFSDDLFDPGGDDSGGND